MFDGVRDLYNKTILERGRKPLHMRALAEYDVTAKGDNPMCGDRVEVWVKLGDSGVIAETGYKARGCEISVVSADLMVEAVAGHSPAATRALFSSFRQMVETGLCADCADALQPLQPLSAVHKYKSRIKCATLPWHALIAALDGTTASVSSEGGST